MTDGHFGWKWQPLSHKFKIPETYLIRLRLRSAWPLKNIWSQFYNPKDRSITLFVPVNHTHFSVANRKIYVRNPTVDVPNPSVDVIKTVVAVLNRNLYVQNLKLHVQNLTVDVRDVKLYVRNVKLYVRNLIIGVLNRKTVINNLNGDARNRKE